MRLIDADALWETFRDKQCEITKYKRYHQLDDEEKEAYDQIEAILDAIDNAPTIDPVVFCRNCAAHNSCADERNFLSEGITEPFCCRGNLKTNTQEVKK